MAAAPAPVLDLGELYQQHRNYVFYVCYRFLKNHDDAEEMTQDVFLQLLKVPEGKSVPRIQQFQGRSKFRTWLHSMTARMCLMRLRNGKFRPPVVSLDELMQPGEEGEGTFQPPAGPMPTPHLTLTIAGSIAELAPGYRATVVLHDLWGLEYHEAAVVMHCTIGTVKSQHFKAHQVLRKILMGEKVAHRGRPAKEKPACT